MTPEECLAKYDWLVKKLAFAHRRQWALSHEPLDDHLQVARIGLLSALKSWKPEGGSSFSSWATTQIRWELQKYDKLDQVRWSTNRDGKRLRVGDMKDLPDAAGELGLPKRPLSLDAAGETTGSNPTELYAALDQLEGWDAIIVERLLKGERLERLAKSLKISMAELQERIQAIRDKL